MTRGWKWLLPGLVGAVIGGVGGYFGGYAFIIGMAGGIALVVCIVELGGRS